MLTDVALQVPILATDASSAQLEADLLKCNLQLAHARLNLTHLVGIIVINTVPYCQAGLCDMALSSVHCRPYIVIKRSCRSFCRACFRVAQPVWKLDKLAVDLMTTGILFCAQKSTCVLSPYRILWFKRLQLPAGCGRGKHKQGRTGHGCR